MLLCLSIGRGWLAKERFLCLVGAGAVWVAYGATKGGFLFREPSSDGMVAVLSIALANRVSEQVVGLRGGGIAYSFT